MNPLNIAPPDSFIFASVTIYYYSVCIALGLIAAYWLLQRRISKTKLSPLLVDNALLYFLVGSLIGARLGFIVQNSDFFSASPLLTLSLSTGGLSIHGALLGGLATLIIFTHRQKVPLLAITDLFVAPLLLGQIIGRFGNYFNQELYGYPTELPWKLFIDVAHRPESMLATAFYHPTFLYEMLLNGIGLWILLTLSLKKEGIASFSYLLIYGVVRFIVEIFRISDQVWGVLSLAQIVSIVMIMIAITGILKLKSGLVANDVAQKV